MSVARYDKGAFLDLSIRFARSGVGKASVEYAIQRKCIQPTLLDGNAKKFQQRCESMGEIVTPAGVELPVT